MGNIVENSNEQVADGSPINGTPSVQGVKKNDANSTAKIDQDELDCQTGLVLTIVGYLIIAISLVTDCRDVIGISGVTLGLLLLVLLACIGGSFNGSKFPFVFLTGATGIITLVSFCALQFREIFSWDGFLFLGLPIIACIIFMHPSVSSFLKSRAKEVSALVCPHCGGQLPSLDVSLCKNCGKPVNPRSVVSGNQSERAKSSVGADVIAAEKKLFCTNCGAPFSESDTFCGKCGVKR